MPTFSTARKNVVLLIVLLAVQLLLASFSASRPAESTGLESATMRATAPFVAIGRGVSGGVRNLVTGMADLISAHSRNVALEFQLRRQATELARHREAYRENARLRQLLGMQQQLAPRSLAASVITSNLSGQTNMIVINRGERHRVAAEQAVVAWGGAVGRVLSVDPGHAKVRLLSDPNSGVAGVVQRSRAQGIVFGRAGESLVMRYVPRFSDVVHGDRVVTSGIDGIFPRGFGIGRVSAIVESPDGVQTIQLEPEVVYGRLEEVLVIQEFPVDEAGEGQAPQAAPSEEGR